jgi:cytochrome c553
VILPPTARIAVTAAAALLAAASATAPGLAADTAKGRKIAAAKCQVCHGLDGLAKLPQAPNLAGQTEPYLAEQMEAFRSGERKNEMMTVVAKPLSDGDIADLAAYYAAIEVKIGKVPGE